MKTMNRMKKARLSQGTAIYLEEEINDKIY